jgi:hypothetical protein
LIYVLIYVDQYIAALDKYGELRHLHVPVEMMHAGAAIVSAPMPRTNQQAALQNTLSEGAAAARTDSVEGMDFAVQIAERVFVATYRDLGCCARWE